MFTFRYGVAFRKDTDPAFETHVSIDHPANPAEINDHADVIADYARAYVAANYPEVELDGYSPYCIMHNKTTIKKF
jgi:hypothetical protein